MARIIDLKPFVPEDIQIVYEGETYLIPGDLSTAVVFRLVSLYEQLGELEKEIDAGEGPDRAEQSQIVLGAQQQLLELLRIRQPDLEAFPFGFASWARLLTALLEEYGIVSRDVEPDPDEEEGGQSPPVSRRSSGSPRSSRSSASPRTTG